MRYKLMIPLLFLIVAGNVMGAELFKVTGKVTKIAASLHSYNPYNETERGVAAFWVEGVPDACGTGLNRVAIGSDHPIYDTVVSLMLTAKVTGKTVRIAYLDTCTVRYNSWDFAYVELNE